MTAYRVDRAHDRGALWFRLAEPVIFDPIAPALNNEVWRRARRDGYVDNDDYYRGSCCADARPGKIIILPA